MDSYQFYFTSFEGNKSSLLYSFYINAHKILFSYYQDLVISDSLPIYDVFKPLNRLANDFILPFKNLLSAEYKLTYFSIDDHLYTKSIVLKSNINLKSSFFVSKNLNGTIKLLDSKIQLFESTINGAKFEATCEVL
jgi:hypothetical protein